MSSAICFNLDQSRILSSGNELKDILPMIVKTGNCVLTYFLIHHFEAIPNSKKLQMTTKMWLSKDFKIQIAKKTLWKKVKLLI